MSKLKQYVLKHLCGYIFLHLEKLTPMEVNTPIYFNNTLWMLNKEYIGFYKRYVNIQKIVFPFQGVDKTMPKYSTIDEGLNANQNKIERISYLFAIFCFLLGLLSKRWFIYGDMIVTLILILIFSVICYQIRMNYVRNINRWFYARFHQKNFTLVFFMSFFFFILSIYVFLILFLGNFFITLFGVNLSDGVIYRRVTQFLLNDIYLGSAISKVILFYMVIFIEEYIMIFIILLRLYIFREKTVNEIMSYSTYYLQEDIKHEWRR